MPEIVILTSFFFFFEQRYLTQLSYVQVGILSLFKNGKMLTC